MTAAKKPSSQRRAAPVTRGTPVTPKLVTRRAGVPSELEIKPKATTLRLKPSLQEGLEVLQESVNRPINKLVNDAVEEFLVRETERLKRDLHGMLARIKAVRQADPQFKMAVKAFVQAETRHARSDPAEGVIIVGELGPSQREVRSLLGRK